MTEKKNCCGIDSEFARCWSECFTDCTYREGVEQSCRFLTEDMYCVCIDAVIDAVKAGLKND
jgi:hypothetical protein